MRVTPHPLRLRAGLARGECHVWWARADDYRPELELLLDETERTRLGRLARRRDRDRFVVGASLARTMVADYLATSAEDVSLDRTCAECGASHGKPRVVGGDAAVELSVSHSGDLVAAALVLEKAVGVDVERGLPDRADVLELVDDVLCRAEAHRLRALPSSKRAAGFLSYWTRKESVVKATGEGLRVPLGSFAVTGPDETPRLLAWAARPHMVELVTLTDLRPGPGHSACVAVLGSVTRVVESGASKRLAAVAVS